MKTCGQCEHYEPTRNIYTGRALPSHAGKCGWKPDIKWPIAFLSWNGMLPFFTQQRMIGKCTTADNCDQFQPKARPAKKGKPTNQHKP